MKKANMLLCVIISLVVTFAHAATTQKDEIETIIQAQKGYVKLLKSENPALRHEGICQLAQLKSQHPEINFKDCKKHLAKIAEKDAYYHLRDYATLASMYLEDKLLSKDVKLEYKGDPTEFFDELHELAHLHFYEDIYFNKFRTTEKDKKQ